MGGRKRSNGALANIEHIAEPLRPLAVPIESLTLDPANARAHGERNLKAIESSLARFGQRAPLVVQRDGMVVRAGNGRLEAARKLGWSHIAALVVDESSIDATAFSIADNRTAELAEWDDSTLAALLGDLQQHDVDIAEIGFDQKELDKLLAADAPPVEEDEVPDSAPPRVKAGELWQLGGHRVLCGDATSEEEVGRLMGGERADVCLTDPPYSVNYDRSQAERGGSKDAHSPYREAGTKPTAVLGFMEHVPSDVMVWTYPVDRHFQDLAAAYREHGWEFRRELVWVKNTFSFWPSANYQQKHEPVMVAARRGKPIGGHVPANATTVLEHDKPPAHSDHPTAKPAALWGDLMGNHTPADGLVYDPFLGSGTTLIAAEQLNRTCYGLEIEPKYCDVILARWEALTGERAKKL